MDFPFAGAWVLRQFCISFSDQRPVFYPFGERAKGMIIYSAPQGVDDAGHCVGQLSAVLMADARPVMSSSRLEDSYKANDAEKAAAFDSYLHYAGRYTWQGDRIVHQVDMALDPSVIGTQQVRALQYDAESGELVLSYDISARSGIVRHYQLVWQRAKL